MKLLANTSKEFLPIMNCRIKYLSLMFNRFRPHESPELKFLCSVRINGRELGRGVG